MYESSARAASQTRGADLKLPGLAASDTRSLFQMEGAESCQLRAPEKTPHGKCGRNRRAEPGIAWKEQPISRSSAEPTAISGLWKWSGR
jgi:hypothetical protein